MRKGIVDGREWQSVGRGSVKGEEYRLILWQDNSITKLSSAEFQTLLLTEVPR